MDYDLDIIIHLKSRGIVGSYAIMFVILCSRNITSIIFTN